MVVAGIGVTAAFGGLAQAADEPPPKVARGAVVDQGEFRTQFVRAVDTVEKGTFGEQKRYLLITARVTNLGDETVGVGLLPEPGKIRSMPFSFAGSVLRVRPEIKTEYGPDVYASDFGIKSRFLQPDVTATVFMKYELEPTATAPTSVTVDVGRFVFEPLGLRDQTHYWQLVGDTEDDETFVPEVAAEVTLPVKQERG
ncbi:hypothetical protein GCM10023193_21010 [Planotetraspora kaengkrachanensis]|uniref:Uncharacterized protein n=1 Tax=Planotetraspora kaengkrachanensis TaxID=575193 RepID=A0A8J3PZ63_9ACTN|nr:hypothetical protein Pka01_68650 [Planotetraspora kaengkrachanensis]